MSARKKTVFTVNEKPGGDGEGTVIVRGSHEDDRLTVTVMQLVDDNGEPVWMVGVMASGLTDVTVTHGYAETLDARYREGDWQH